MLVMMYAQHSKNASIFTSLFLLLAFLTLATHVRAGDGQCVPYSLGKTWTYPVELKDVYVMDHYNWVNMDSSLIVVDEYAVSACGPSVQKGEGAINLVIYSGTRPDKKLGNGNRNVIHFVIDGQDQYYWINHGDHCYFCLEGKTHESIKSVEVSKSYP